MKHKTYRYFTFLLILTAFPLSAQDQQDDLFSEMSALEIMQEVYRRHQQYAFIYEEQSMVMMDRNGNRDTRKAKRYSRIEDDGSLKFMLIFDSPAEIRGVALLAGRDPSGLTSKFIYLPAFGEKLIESISSRKDGKFLGTDFSVESIAGEILDDYIYTRRPDKKVNGVEYFVIDVYQKESMQGEETLPNGKQANRRHFVAKNNFYITNSQYFDRQGRVFKKQSQYDLKLIDGEMWRADMILMEDSKEQHQSLIKINRRVFSRDYVSEEIFTAEWLFENYPFNNQPEKEDEDIIPDDEAEITPDDNVNTSANVDEVSVQ